MIRENIVLRQAMALVSPPTVVTGQAISSALEFCCSRTRTAESPAELMRQEDPQAHDYFRYGLARSLAAYLGDVDATLKEVFIADWRDTADEVEESCACATTPLSLIIHVQRKTAALESLLSCLDAAVTAEYRDLLAPRAAGLISLLDATLVNAEEVAGKMGYGALMSSVHWRPTRIWERERAG